MKENLFVGLAAIGLGLILGLAVYGVYTVLGIEVRPIATVGGSVSGSLFVTFFRLRRW